MRPTFTPSLKTIEYATEEEVLEFANAVRKAGGGELIPALLPSKPSDGNACLIARALNFESSVLPTIHYDENGNPHDIWAMRVGPYISYENRDETIKGSTELARTIGEALGLPWKAARNGVRAQVVLPEHIGNAANAFDRGVGWTTKYNERLNNA